MNCSHIHEFSNLPLFNDFVNKSFDKFSADKLSSDKLGADKLSFSRFGLPSNLIGTSPGIILATGLLIHDRSLVDPFYDSFVSQEMDPTSYLWPFLAILVSYLDESRVLEIVMRVQNRVKLDANTYKDEDMKRLGYILRAIGLELSDLVE